MDSIKKEIIKLKSDGLGDAELARVKKQLKGNYALSQESSAALMRVYGRNALFLDTTFDFDKKIEEIDMITKDSVMDIVNYIFDFDKVVTSYVGKEIDFNPLDIIKG